MISYCKNVTLNIKAEHNNIVVSNKEMKDFN